MVTLGVLVAATVFSVSLVSMQLPSPYMDEEFHIPQLSRYLDWKFTEWDPKITTFPGMYLLTWLLCSLSPLLWVVSIVSAARLYNSIVALVTLLLLRQASPMYAELIYLFPPLFATFSVYYTDPTALCLLVAHFLAIKQRKAALSTCVFST